MTDTTGRNKKWDSLFSVSNPSNYLILGPEKTKKLMEVNWQGIKLGATSLTGEEAIEMSIASWEWAIWWMIENDVVILKMANSCAFCVLYSAHGNCTGCPIATKTGHGSCVGTPYYNTRLPKSKDVCYAIRVFEKEVEFLKSLREPEPKEASVNMIKMNRKAYDQKWAGASVSRATLRSPDLLESFISAAQEMIEDLANFNPKKSARHRDELARSMSVLPSNYEDMDSNEIEKWIDRNAETASYIINEELPDILNDLAPNDFWFGSHEGDGSDFGFWTDVGFDVMEAEML